MGKRSSFKRNPRDYYQTPAAAVAPLLPHLPPETRFIEPCAGDYALAGHLEIATMSCVQAFDIHPMEYYIDRQDALGDWGAVKSADCIITNPPWDRKILHPMIEKFSAMLPTWLLFDADWMHTVQSAELMRLCKKVVSVGSVKWIPDSKMTGKDNCAWYLFDRTGAPHETVFVGRTPKTK